VFRRAIDQFGDNAWGSPATSEDGVAIVGGACGNQPIDAWRLRCIPRRSNIASTSARPLRAAIATAVLPSRPFGSVAVRAELHERFDHVEAVVATDGVMQRVVPPDRHLPGIGVVLEKEPEALENRASRSYEAACRRGSRCSAGRSRRRIAITVLSSLSGT
jgi:hypothetical protein